MASLSVLSTCHQVLEQSRFVRVDQEAIARLVHHSDSLQIPPLRVGPAPYHYFDNTATTAEWFFVLDTLNHCFWPETGSPLWEVQYGSKKLSGYWALAASLTRAMEEGITLHQPETLTSLNRRTLAHVFRGTSMIPLLDERLENLRSAGEILIDRFQGSFIHVLEEGNNSAVKLVLLVAEEFPSFNDTATYNSAVVHFFKKAQLLCHDLWCTFSGSSWGEFHDLEQLTAFADYKLPQVLRYLGIIKYEPKLAKKVDNLTLIAPGTAEEVEIRAATIWAVEWIRQELNRNGQVVTSAQLDNWLWNLGQDDTYRTLPYHRTRTIFY
jgi:hypothetical protein